ncbi:MAG: class I SAM-dependent methyltransferase [Oligoflexus sp.]
MRIIHGEAVRLKVFTRPMTIKKYLKSHNVKMLNIGAGPNRKEGWLTADAFKPEADIYMNARTKWPFPDNTFDVIYSEHMLEHIHVDKVPHLLSEAFRVLKPGGLFRVTVPDLEIHATNYVNRNDEFFKPIIDKYKARWDKQKEKYWLIRSNGGAFMSRAVQRFYRHRWMYDFETLSSCLDEVGFSKCIKQECGKSINAAAGDMDRPDRAFETLYIDAVK